MASGAKPMRWGPPRSLAAFEEVLRQGRQLVATIAQGREADHQRRQGEVELGTQSLVPQADLGLDGRGRQQPDARVERLDQPGLEVAREAQDLVDQQGGAFAPARAVAPSPVSDRVGVRGAEELALEDLRRQGLAVERDQRTLAVRPMLMDRPRDVPLPGPRLADDQHRHRRARRPAGPAPAAGGAPGRTRSGRPARSVPGAADGSPAARHGAGWPRNRGRSARPPSVRTVPSRPMSRSSLVAERPELDPAPDRSPPAW